MQLPTQLERLRQRKIWLCYPMIPNPAKHGGVGGYDKPPINPYTLRNGSSDNPASLATFDEAAAQIGKTASVKVKGYDGFVECQVVGVGIALKNTGVCGVDLDNVFDRENRKATREAVEITNYLETYTEFSPSGKGLHILFLGELPQNVKKVAAQRRDVFGTEKGEYQLFDSGYMTVTGDVAKDYDIAERTEQIADVCGAYFDEVPAIESPSTYRPAAAARPSAAPSVVSSGYTYERWLWDVQRLSDAEVLDAIFKSGSTGQRVQALYNGDLSEYGNDHSRADQALVSYLYSFTDDRQMTERLFRCSRLYRATGKSRNYIERTLNRAEKRREQLIGHITWTQEERRAYAQAKEAQERAAKQKQFKRPF